jgi:putative oxidoreductase
MTTTASIPAWKTAATLLARLVFGGLFIMACVFKFTGMEGTAGYIAAAGFPAPLFLAWVAAFFELALALCFLTGAFFTEASLLAGIYVVFLAFVFHGSATWTGGTEMENQLSFGSFIDHFTFLAGLLFAAVNGPGRFALGYRIISRA